jgi:hypothetical protein
MEMRPPAKKISGGPKMIQCSRAVGYLLVGGQHAVDV